MTKLGSIDMKELPNDTIEDMSSSDEQETQKEISTPPSSVQRSEPVPLTPKQKRKMSEKQLEALKRGRAKKLEMNLKSREGKKKVPKEEKEEEEPTSKSSTPVPVVETKKRKTKKQKLSLPPPPSPQDSEDSEDSEDEEEYERYDGTKESDVERTVGKYLKRYMDKSMKRERSRMERYPDPPKLTRSGYDDILFV